MTRLVGVVAVVAGFAVAIVIGALVVSADPEAPPDGSMENLSPTLDARQVEDANRAVHESDVVASLSGGRSFMVESTGAWTTVGELSGAAVLIDFGDVVELSGDWPVMEPLNHVSEAELAAGATVPEKLEIRFTTRTQSISGREFSVLVDLTGQIRNISVAPARAPEQPQPAEPGPAPLTVTP